MSLVSRSRTASTKGHHTTRHGRHHSRRVLE
jgi:hypothetical protein